MKAAGVGGHIIMNNLPTYAAGLPSGALWSVKHRPLNETMQ